MGTKAYAICMPTTVPRRPASQPSTQRPSPNGCFRCQFKNNGCLRYFWRLKDTTRESVVYGFQGTQQRSHLQNPGWMISQSLSIQQQHLQLVSKQWQPKATSVTPLPQDKAMVKVCDTTLTYQNPPLQKEKNIAIMTMLSRDIQISIYIKDYKGVVYACNYTNLTTRMKTSLGNFTTTICMAHQPMSNHSRTCQCTSS